MLGQMLLDGLPGFAPQPGDYKMFRAAFFDENLEGFQQAEPVLVRMYGRNRQQVTALRHVRLPQ